MPATDAVLERAALRQHLAGAVREAGALALDMFQASVKSWTKANASPVTEADIAVDQLLRRRLTAAAPGCGWLSEESEDDPARLAARRLWVVDPIDGTRAYLRRRPDWSISAALVENGRPVIAVVFAPVEQALFAATAGEGATLNGALMAASSGATLDGARIAGPKTQIERLAALGPRIVAVPRVHSLALRIARVAQGALDAAITSSGSHDWDLAAADLLVHEAGGALTTPQGRPPTYNRADTVQGAVLAAGRARHASLIELVRTRLCVLA